MSIKDTQRFAELEYSLQKYFDGKVASVMNNVRSDLGNKQAEEMKEYSTSLHGILSMMATSNMPGGDPYQHLKYTGKWNSKTVEDYVDMCKDALLKDKSFQKDIAVLASEWRNAVVKEIGREKYDQLSAQLGMDLAYAYVDTRMNDLMLQKLVKNGMPKSTSEYIIRKACQGSIWGLGQELSKSPLTREIEEKGEKAFKPSATAKAAGKAGSLAIDAVSMGVSSWKSLATFVGGDLLVSSLMNSKPTAEQKEQVMEAAISKGVFGSDKNVFSDFRTQSSQLYSKDNPYLSSLNSRLQNKIPVPTKTLMSFETLASSKPVWQPKPLPNATVDRTTGKYKDVPLIVAPGQEEAWLADVTARDNREKVTDNRPHSENITPADFADNADLELQNEESEKSAQSVGQTNTVATNGWEQLLKSTGFEGFGNTLTKLPYVLSMLPDVLVGMFTGKTKSLDIGNTWLPVASIFAGLWVKNPILKIALITMGGANLLNKAGKESLNWQREDAKQADGMARNGSGSTQVQYKRYEDEPLNSRITNPVLQGNALVANIDRVPCTIQLTKNVVDAYNAGALPLNTLANAILAKHDAATRQYNQAESINNTETIHRTR